MSAQRAYLQHTPQGDQAIIYLEGDDLQRTFQHLRTAQDPFAVWVRQRTKDLFDGVDFPLQVFQQTDKIRSTLAPSHP